MAAAVQLASLANGVLTTTAGAVRAGVQVFVYQRGTTTQVQLYADSGLTQTMTQPVVSTALGAVPGYVAPGQSIDFFDPVTSSRAQAEPVSASTVVSVPSSGTLNNVPLDQGNGTFVWGAQSGGGGGSSLLEGGTTTVSVKASPYNAHGNGKYVFDANITSGSNQLSSTNAAFTSADNGKHVLVAGAGAGQTSLGTTSSLLSTGAPITSLPCNALAGSIPAGNISLVSGTHQQTISTVGANSGATSIPLQSVTPQFAFPSGTSILSQADPLHTTISSVSGGVATLAANAGATVQSASTVYGTDDTAAIQSAINAVGTAGRGQVIFPDATYIIAGALQTAATVGDSTGSMTYNSQLTLPAQGLLPKIVITLMGATAAGANAQIGSNPGGFNSPGLIETNGPILQSMLVGQSTAARNKIPSMLGGPVDLTGNFTDLVITNCHVDIDGLRFRCPSNPSISACNLQRVESVSVGKRLAVAVDTVERPAPYIDVGPWPQLPTHPSGQGLLLPGRGCAQGSVGQVFASGFYAGLTTGEHTTIDYAYPLGNYMAVSLGPCGHLATIGYLNPEQNPYVLGYADPVSGVGNLISSGVALQIEYLDIEDGQPSLPAEAGWVAPINHVNDPTNLITGAVKWWSPGPPTKLIINSALNLSFYYAGLPQFPQAYATTNGSHSIATGSWTDLPWDETVSGFNDTGYDLPGMTMWNPGGSHPEQIELLREGLWLIEAAIEFAGNATGYRGLQLIAGISGPTSGLETCDIVPSFAGANIPCSVTLLKRFPAGTTIRVQGFQNSGGNLQWNADAVVMSHLSVVLLGQ